MKVAVCLPGLAAAPLAGFLGDKFGAEWVATPPLIAALPWFILLISPNRLIAYAVYYAFIGEYEGLRQSR